jgi:hypothetical protein
MCRQPPTLKLGGNLLAGAIRLIIHLSYLNIGVAFWQLEGDKVGKSPVPCREVILEHFFALC